VDVKNRRHAIGVHEVSHNSVDVAVCCSVLLCVAVCCSVLQCGFHKWAPQIWTIQILSQLCGYCSVLQCVAVSCSELQCGCHE